MSDPLAGLRKAINAREVTTLIWPADRECPVKKGERYELQSCVIEIEQPVRKLIKGRGAEWHVKFVRHEEDRAWLLRFTPPTRPPSDDNLGLTDTEKARRESAYTSTTHAASPHEPESVGPDWEDKKRGERELERLAQRKARGTTDADIDRAALRLKQAGKALGRKGKDLTPLLDDIYERLAAEEREAA